MNNKDILKQWHKSIWEDGDISAVGKLMADDATTAVLLPDARLTPVDVETFAEVFLTHVSNLRGDFVMMIEDGDWVSALVNITGTSTARGCDFMMTSSLFAKIKDDKITEVYSHFDQFKMFEAFGALPEDSFAMCLMGETLG